MKPVFYLFVLPSFLFSFISCSTNKHYLVQRKTDLENARIPDERCFVEFNDGTIVHYSSLTLVTGIMQTPHLLADHSKRIEAKDIRSYQNNEHYAISQTVYKPKRRSFVAVETLPGFAVRIAEGDLNVYVRKTTISNKAMDEFFLQNGNNGEIREYSSSLMNELIKNNPEAKDLFKSKRYRAERPKIKATAEVYNNAQSFTKSR